MAQRTALINRIRGILSELGIVLPLTYKAFYRGVHQALEDLPGYCNQVIAELISELDHVQERIAQSEHQIQQLAKDDTLAQRLMQLRGIGPATAPPLLPASAMGMISKTVASSVRG